MFPPAPAESSARHAAINGRIPTLLSSPPQPGMPEGRGGRKLDFIIGEKSCEEESALIRLISAKKADKHEKLACPLRCWFA